VANKRTYIDRIFIEILPKMYLRKRKSSLNFVCHPNQPWRSPRNINCTQKRFLSEQWKQQTSLCCCWKHTWDSLFDQFTL